MVNAAEKDFGANGSFEEVLDWDLFQCNSRELDTRNFGRDLVMAKGGTWFEGRTAVERVDGCRR